MAHHAACLLASEVKKSGLPVYKRFVSRRERLGLVAEESEVVGRSGLDEWSPRRAAQNLKLHMPDKMRLSGLAGCAFAHQIMEQSKGQSPSLPARHDGQRGRRSPSNEPPEACTAVALVWELARGFRTTPMRNTLQLMPLGCHYVLSRLLAMRMLMPTFPRHCWSWQR